MKKKKNGDTYIKFVSFNILSIDMLLYSIILYDIWTDKL